MKFGKKFTIYGLSAMVLFMLFGCDNSLLKSIENTPVVTRSSSVSKRIGELKNAGLLDSLLQDQDNRSVSDNGLEDIDKINYFILNTDEALAEIAEMENGTAQINLITALFTGGTIGEVADAMAAISEDMAIEYLTAMEEQLKALESSETSAQGRSVTSIRDIRISFSDAMPDSSPNARAIYASNFNWDTIGWYAGFCAATTAGVFASTCWMPWVSIPGIVAATAGGISMSVQLVKWYQCSEFRQLANNIASIAGSYISNKDSFDIAAHKSKIEDINKLFGGQIGAKLVTITGLTSATIIACAFSPVGKAATSAAKTAWANIATFLKSIIPSWFNISGSSNAVTILFTIPL